MWKENNVDMEALASFEEDLLPHAPKKDMNLSKSVLYDMGIPGFGKESFSKEIQEEQREYVNPYTSSKTYQTESMGNINPSPDKEPGLFDKAKNWISENPGTALLAALLIGGGTYLLINYLKDRNGKNESSSASRRRKRKPRPTENESNKEADSDSSVIAKEVAIGIAGAGAGALIGTVIKEYSVTAAVPVAVLGIVKKNVPLIAAAVGLVLSGSLRKVFKHFFGNDDSGKNAQEMKDDGYLKTMLGYIKPSETRLSGA
ncbi:MAG: hypothetical protein K2X86_08995 [Cytophagaceae bacterium]|nr:hypothetical protein [Cytophagaceae bacterium]